MSSHLYTVEILPTAAVIAFRIGLDVDIESFNEINETLIEEWPIVSGSDVMVDLTQSRYMGSVLLGLLVNIRQRARAGGGRVVVIGASPRLMEVFRSSNLDRLLLTAPTRAEGLVMLK